MQNYRVFGNAEQYRISQQYCDTGDNDKVKDESSPMTCKIVEQQRRALIPLKEDLADWISKLTGDAVYCCYS